MYVNVASERRNFVLFQVSTWEIHTRVFLLCTRNEELFGLRISRGAWNAELRTKRRAKINIFIFSLSLFCLSVSLLIEHGWWWEDGFRDIRSFIIETIFSFCCISWWVRIGEECTRWDKGIHCPESGRWRMQKGKMIYDDRIGGGAPLQTQKRIGNLS